MIPSSEESGGFYVVGCCPFNSVVLQLVSYMWCTVVATRLIFACLLHLHVYDCDFSKLVSFILCTYRGTHKGRGHAQIRVHPFLHVLRVNRSV